MLPLMETDSERLMTEGVATGVENFEAFLAESGWNRDSLDRTVCHQVGVRHRQTMLQAMGLPEEKDLISYPWLGNTGSVALPTSLAAAAYDHSIPNSARVGLFGIGSGINSVMLGCEWQSPFLGGNFPHANRSGAS